MKMSAIKLGIAAAFLLPAQAALALDFQWDDWNLTVNNRFTSGVMLRMKDRSYNNIGKTNVPGQSNLCASDTCISLDGTNNEPNQRLVNAAGAFSGVNMDNGDLNYDKYDIVAASNRLSSDAVLKYGDWLARLRLIAFYDPVNAGFEEHHNDTRYQPASTPRTDTVERVYAKGLDLFDGYVSKEFKWGETRNAQLSIGYQTVRWGESTLVARNAIAEINPPSAIMLHTAGAEISEVFRPVPAIVLSTDLFEGVSAEFFYQLKWQKLQADPSGSFFADQDLIDGKFAAISLGQAGEDPNKLQRIGPNNPISQVSSTSQTVYLSAPKEARDMGQVGVRVNYNSEFNGGTEFGFYFLNYHSRYPYASARGADYSCTRNADTSNPNTAAANTLVACQGFNGTLLGRQDQHNPEREPLPIDTVQIYLEYPENIQMYGLSFNTNYEGISFAGEYSFRPNLPLQVQINDVIFTGLQPAFPANAFPILPGAVGSVENNAALQQLSQALGPLAAAAGVPINPVSLQQLGAAFFPSADIAVPSYLSHYRGYGTVRAHQEIPGYERFNVGQFDLTAIKAFSTNPFFADQILVIGEVGFTHVLNMPDLNQLQIEGSGANRTHYSIGQDEKFTSCNRAAPTVDCYATLNPHRQTTGFADDFAWGVRSIVKGEYNDVIFGWSFKPTIIMQWDIGGIAPYPIQNFVEGRKQLDLGTDVNITQSFSARVNYETYWGAGQYNTLIDRDNFALSFSYAF